MSVKTLAARLHYDGYLGDSGSLGRIEQQKLRSLRSALKASYQSRLIETDRGTYRALINSDNLKSDYDKKIVSVEWDSGLEGGKVFRCLDDDSHWLVYLPYLTETAYLHSEIIRCRYTLEINGKKYWIYFQGPTETDINWYTKNGIEFSEPNLSGTIYITKDENTTNFFDRFDLINIEGRRWQVEVVDRISVPGVLELEVGEYFNNKYEDLPEIRREECDEIMGRTQVNQGETLGYEIQERYYNPKYHWEVRGNSRVEVVEELEDSRIAKVKVHEGAIGSFQVVYGGKNSGFHINVSINRICNPIKGPHEAYTYDKIYYTIDDNQGRWYVYPTTVAKIVEETKDGIKVEVLSRSNSEFTVEHVDINGETDVLVVPVKTL